MGSARPGLEAAQGEIDRRSMGLVGTVPQSPWAFTLCVSSTLYHRHTFYLGNEQQYTHRSPRIWIYKSVFHTYQLVHLDQQHPLTRHIFWVRRTNFIQELYHAFVETANSAPLSLRKLKPFVERARIKPTQLGLHQSGSARGAPDLSSSDRSNAIGTRSAWHAACFDMRRRSVLQRLWSLLISMNRWNSSRVDEESREFFDESGCRLIYWQTLPKFNPSQTSGS